MFEPIPAYITDKRPSTPDAEKPKSLDDIFGGFQRDRQRRYLERQWLPYLRTVSDFDIVNEVGYHQFSGRPLSVKQLLLAHLAPPASTLRRLERLVRFNVIDRRCSAMDRRVHELRLSPTIVEVYLRLHGEPFEKDRAIPSPL